ncbi:MULTISPECIES: hypothetical protein [Streptacidiphilus]|uniref:Uncharacterized protein n=1 Tax=Streptacidiphilus cavernicola TaxID=3342716 RepID=A0ABV6V089_9ACTN|nr:hypothetical protein [Streptacidiphilus jeojiense]
MADEQPTSDELLAMFDTDEGRAQMETLTEAYNSFASSQGMSPVSVEEIWDMLHSDQGRSMLSHFIPVWGKTFQLPDERSQVEGRAPADLADRELHQAAFGLVSNFSQNVAQRRIQAVFQEGVTGDPAFPFPIPTKADQQVLTLLTVAAEAAGAATALLGAWASTSAFAQLRCLYETQALVAWLVNGTEGTLEARALALTLDTIDLFGRGEDHWYKAAKTSGNPELRKHAVRWRKLKSTLQKSLDTLWTQRGYPQVEKPNRQLLFDKHLTDAGGYPAFAMFSNAGGHPSLMQPILLYTHWETGQIGYDFANLHMQRAYWITQVGTAFLGLMDLAAPALAWDDWAEESTALRAEFEPVAAEASKRYSSCFDAAMAKRSGGGA